MAERKDILVAILKALLAGLESSVIVKIPATFIAELAASDKGKVKELSQVSGDKFEELLNQMGLATTNAAVAAVGIDQVKLLISNMTGLANEKVEALKELTEQQFKDTWILLDRIDCTTTDTNVAVKKVLAMLESTAPKIEKQDIMDILHTADDGSEEVANAIKSFKEGDFKPAKELLISISSNNQITEEIEASDSAFICKEEELQALIRAGIFYEGTAKLDILIAKNTPTSIDLGELLQLINNDVDLAIYFYKENYNPEWLDILNSAGEFKQLVETDITNDMLVRMKAFYLVEASKSRPKEVVDLILGLDVKDWFIHGILLEALSAKPLDVVKEGLVLIKKYFRTADYNINWYSHGERSAKFMVAIAGKCPDGAFEIAEILLAIHKAGDEKYRDNIKSFFKGYYYKELLSKYYKQLWQSDPFRTTKQLIDVFKNYLDELEEDDFDLEGGFYCTIERLDQIDNEGGRRIIKNIIQSICDLGKDFVESEHKKTDELFAYLEELNSPIFDRIKMYLLRFVSGNGQIGRVNAIIGDKKFLDDMYLSVYGYEYKLLLRDRFENISDEAKGVFIDWVEERQVAEDEIDHFAEWFKKVNGRDHTKDDLSKYEDSLRARKLYLVRGKGEFKDLYEKYKVRCGKSDDELAPISKVSEARFVSPDEGSPGNSSDMFEMEPVEAIEYINTPSRWIIEKTNEWAFHTPEVALSHVFEKVVIGKVDDYASLELENLQKLKPRFLERYFNGIVNVFREKNLKEDSLLKVLSKSESIVADNINSPDYNWTFRLILEIIETILNRDELKKSVVPENGELIWNIIDTLRTYKGDKERFTSERGAHSACINSVSGKAFELVIRFGLFFKNVKEQDYNAEWAEKIRGSIKDVIDNINERWVRCVLGFYFPQIHWLEKDFTEANVDNIFDVKDDEAWKDVWGSYLSWSRAYKNIFMFLKEKGKYADAIGSIEICGEEDDIAMRVDEGLMQHLMIAYFNSWIEWDDPLLIKFFEESPAKLRGKAADFLKTGFKEYKSDEKKEKGERVKLYWQERLKIIGSNPKKNFDEAIEFVDWVEGTLFDAKETLELTLKTLELTSGELGRSRDEVDLVKGACKIGKGNELLALKCMNKMMEGKPEWISLSIYKDTLEEFLDHVVKLGNDTDGIAEIRNEAIELVNAYGRRQINDLKLYYEKLKKA